MRLITRSDFGGLVEAMLFTKLGKIDEMKFVRPKDMLPYHQADQCIQAMCSELQKLKGDGDDG